MVEHDPETQELLQSALSTAFTPADLPRASVSPPSAPAPAQPAEAPAPAPAGDAPGMDAHDAWKAEYEAQVARWRADNIEQRTRAEKERERWERIRAEEKAQPASEGQEASEEWPSLAGTSASGSVPRRESPSPADVRDLVAGEKEGHRHHAESSHLRDPSSLSTSQKWEDLPSSMNSSQSYPSMSFPSLSNPDTPPETTQPHHRTTHSHHHHGQSHTHHRDSGPQHVTLSVFDSTLPTKTRALALISSLGINFILPFINGVMLGFGEIFAKEIVVGWFGWGKSRLQEQSRGTVDDRELEARRRR